MKPLRAFLLSTVVACAALGIAAAQAPPPPPTTEPIQVEDLPGEGDPPPVAAPERPVDDLAQVEADARHEYADGNLARARELYLELAGRHGDAASRAAFGVTAAWLSFQLGDRLAAQTQLATVLYASPEAPFRADLYAPEFAALFQDTQRDAVSRRARDAASRTALAVDAIRGDRLEEAERELRVAQTLAPGDPDILYNVALVEMRLGRADAALAGFERVLALERGRPGALDAGLKSQTLNNVAVLYFARGDFEVARTSLEEAVRLTPNDARAWFNLGLTRQRLGAAEEGYAALRRARDLDRRDVDVARALALADIERGDWVEAVALLLDGTRERPEDPELWLQLGRAQRGLGNADGALQSLQTAASLDPANRGGAAASATLLRAEMLRERGDHAGSAEAAGRVLAWRPDDVDAWMFSGLAQLGQRDLAGARRSLERARQLAPRRADVAHNLGSVCLELRDAACAEQAFKAVLELDPANAEVRSLLQRLEAQRLAQAASPPASSGSSGSSGGSRTAGARRGPADLGATLTNADYEPLDIRGLRVDAIVPGGAAERAGLAVGDLVLRVDGDEAESVDKLRKRAARAEGAILDLLRAGKPLKVRLKLG